MSREIRRVPKGWQHPRDSRGRYQPLHDYTWEEALAMNKEYDDDPPDPEWKHYYRKAWQEEPTCYQVYESVSEGTPVSPVFETEAEMIDWLVEQGHSRKAAEGFVEAGYVFSMVVTRSPDGIDIKTGIDMYDE